MSDTFHHYIYPTIRQYVSDTIPRYPCQTACCAVQTPLTPHPSGVYILHTGCYPKGSAAVPDRRKKFFNTARRGLLQHTQRANDYSLRANDYSLRPNVYSLRANGYSLRAADYSQRAADYSQRAADYSQRAADYSLRAADYSLRADVYSLRPNVYSLRYTANILRLHREKEWGVVEDRACAGWNEGGAPQGPLCAILRCGKMRPPPESE
jgi:hypothetical protein